MDCWSPENATEAYIRALKMGKRGKEPDITEFISALAAGNNAKLMVIATDRIAESTTLSLVAAAHQTGGHVVCILSKKSDFNESRKALGHYINYVKFVTGDAKTLLLNDYKEADFVLIDCNIDDWKGVFKAAAECGKLGNRGLIVGYNGFHKSSWPIELKVRFLPIGKGLLVTEMGSKGSNGDERRRRSSKWVVRLDKCTGEKHFYRITSPRQEVEA